MAHLTPRSTLARRHKLEALGPKKSAEHRIELAHLYMIDYLRGWNNHKEDHEEKVKMARKFLDEAGGPRSALGHIVEGQIHEANGELPKAIGEFNKALHLDPDLSIAYAHKANAHILSGEAKKAPELLAKAISSRDPDLGLCYWFMGRAYFNMQNYPDAIWWLNKSVEVRPTTWFSWAHLISAYALKEGGRGLEEPEAQDALKTYHEKFQAHPLGKIRDYYQSQEKYKKAEQGGELVNALKRYYTSLEEAAQGPSNESKP